MSRQTITVEWWSALNAEQKLLWCEDYLATITEVVERLQSMLTYNEANVDGWSALDLAEQMFCEYLQGEIVDPAFDALQSCQNGRPDPTIGTPDERESLIPYPAA